tara:strand:+ start:302 stop:754 length:453 start_codon:yes stop_codon:yes gene_type:complete
MAHNYKNGLHNVGSYQVSGYPYITGSVIDAGTAGNGEVKVQFPSVAKSVTVINTSTALGLRVYFNASSSADSWCPACTMDYPDGAPLSGLHFISLPSNKDSVTFDVKCREIYVAASASGATDGSFELFAVLTGIDSEYMFGLTGSGLTDP